MTNEAGAKVPNALVPRQRLSWQVEFFGTADALTGVSENFKPFVIDFVWEIGLVVPFGKSLTTALALRA